MQDSVTKSGPCVDTAEVFRSDQVNFDSTCAAGEFESPDRRMDVVDLGRNVDRMLLPVTAAIYQNGVEKPAMRWTFEMAIGAITKRPKGEDLELQSQ